MLNEINTSVINILSRFPVGRNTICVILIDIDRMSRAIMNTTSRQRVFKIANVSFVSVILSCQLQVFMTNQVSHLPAKFHVWVDGKLPVSGGQNPALISPDCDINA